MMARAPRLLTVVALTEDEVVGAASVTGNGLDTFQVRDVMVLPEFQGKTVGTQLMREVVAWIEEAVPPGEHVTLLTGTTTTKFYERLGFLGPDAGLTGMYIKR
jgi:GNAT superfamily N-acetyltransferase